MKNYKRLRKYSLYFSIINKKLKIKILIIQLIDFQLQKF